MRKGLFATLEDETGLAQQVGEQGPVVPEVVAEVAEGSAELTQDAGEVGDLVAQVEDAQLADQELQQVADTMQQSIDEGTGLDTGAAQMAEIATESIMNRLGLKGQRIIPATESFGSSNSRVAATRIALESTMDTIKKVWQGILNFLKMVWQKITDFFGKFFANAEKLEKAANELKGKVAEVKGKKAEKDEFEDGGIAKAFAVGTGTTDLQNVITILGNQGSMLKGVNKVLAPCYELVNEATVVGKDLAAGKAANLGKFVDIGGKLLNNASLDGTGGKQSKDGDKTTNTFGPFVGGMTVIGSMTKKDGVLESVEIDFSEIEKAGESKKNKTLTGDQMGTVLDKVIEVAKQAIEYKKTQDEVKKVSVELTKATESVLKAIDNGLEGKENAAEGRKQLAVAKAVVTGGSKIIGRLVIQAPVMAVKAGNSALKYVSASIKQYKEEEKKAEKK